MDDGGRSTFVLIIVACVARKKTRKEESVRDPQEVVMVPKTAFLLLAVCALLPSHLATGFKLRHRRGRVGGIFSGVCEKVYPGSELARAASDGHDRCCE